MFWKGLRVAAAPDASAAMASQKQLVAAQGFLRGVRTLSTYEVTREKHFSQVEKGLRKLPGLTAQQAGSWLEALDEGVWADCQVESMKEILSEKATQGVAQVGGGKHGPQDYSALPYHLLEQCGQERDALLRRLCMHAYLVGLGMELVAVFS